MNRKDHRKSFRFAAIFVILLALTASGGSFWLYWQSVRGAVYATTVSFMEQIADHDRLNIVNQLTNKWEYLDSLVGRLRLNREETLKDVIYNLSVETNATAFDKLYLVTDDGTVYSNSYLENNLSQMPWEQEFVDSTEHFVMRYNEDSREEWGEYLIYGNHLVDPVICETEKIVGVVGLVSISEITGQMRLESFDGKGLALVMQPSGDIITANQNYPEANKNNYLQMLSSAKFKGGGSLEECREAILKNEKIFTEFSTADGGFYALFQPVGYGENNAWYLVLQVDKEVTYSQVRSIIFRSLPFFLLFGTILIAVAYFFYRNLREINAARSAERAKSAFLANMSHEIRTPLNGILGLHYLMRKNLNKPGKMETYLKKAEMSADYLKSIITDVLDMSKIESGQLELFQNEIDLTELVEEVRAVLQTQAEANGLRFSLDYSGVTHSFVKGDAVRVKQVLTNLLGNSLKFTPKGGEMSLKVTQEQEKDKVVTTFVISDTGYGMSEEFLTRIWIPFEQERRIASINGTGLGTTLSKTLVEKMGGNISVVSHLNEGTTFTVVIPFSISDSHIQLKTQDKAIDYDLKGKRVLIAEDNQINRMIISTILSEQGCEITEVCDGKQAFDTFKDNPPYSFDLILMDVQMPVMDGYEATQKIRKLRADGASITIIATTANAFRADVEKALESGMDDVVTKPIDISLLLSKIKNIKDNGGQI